MNYELCYACIAFAKASAGQGWRTWNISGIHVCYLALLFVTISFFACTQTTQTSTSSGFYIQEDSVEGTLSIFRDGGGEPVLVQNAKSGMRPFLHPIMAPDGNGALTQYSPGPQAPDRVILGIYSSKWYRGTYGYNK
jgi:hypothetical protein